MLFNNPYPGIGPCLGNRHNSTLRKFRNCNQLSQKGKNAKAIQSPKIGRRKQGALPLAFSHFPDRYLVRNRFFYSQDAAIRGLACTNTVPGLRFGIIPCSTFQLYSPRVNIDHKASNSWGSDRMVKNFHSWNFTCIIGSVMPSKFRTRKKNLRFTSTTRQLKLGIPENSVEPSRGSSAPGIHQKSRVRGHFR